MELIASSTPESIRIEKIFETDNCYIKGDPNQIKQAITNVSINAVQSMKNGGILTFCLYEKELKKNKNRAITNEGKYLVLAIEDTGVGIKEEIKNQIFLPFFSTKKREGQSGLGLSTAYGIMKNHGGFIEFNSKEDEGSIFYLHFPSFESGEIPNQKKENISFKTEIQKENNEAEEILIVEDEDLIREMLKETLIENGYKVIPARDGVEGFKLFNERKDRIFLTILDLNMPRKNGRELFFDMKKLKGDIKVIITTGYTMDGQVQELLDNGAIDYLKKPFEIPTLLKKIERLTIN